MNLYHISQDVNSRYNTYDSAIVAAPDEAAAKGIHPDGVDEKTRNPAWDDWRGTWTDDPDSINVRLIGRAVEGTPAGVVLASFNAG